MSRPVSSSAIAVTVTGAPRMKTMPMVRLSPCRSPVTRSGMAISQLVTVASRAGSERCTAAVPKKLPETRTAPQTTKTTIHSSTRAVARDSSTPADESDVCVSRTSAITQPMNSRSSLRQLSSGARNCRTVPVRRQTRSITPAVSGVMISRTAEAIMVFSSSSAKSKPPWMKV
ncbi:hypothetical protein WJ438_30830 [Streptomyces sp. GD-15H]|uniref:hypothetical protein n=1 Tax=Streptomyces sp. GD-15H TaxID=3129112 RepID=UPI00324931AB